MAMIHKEFFKSGQLVNVEATIHICATCNLFLRSLQVSQQQTPSLVGLADNIDSKTIFTHNLDIIDSEMIFSHSQGCHVLCYMQQCENRVQSIHHRSNMSLKLASALLLLSIVSISVAFSPSADGDQEQLASGLADGNRVAAFQVDWRS